MARIRSIKPEFWTSEQVMECSLSARLMFIGMWNFADDAGRLPLSPKSIKAQIFPSDDISLDTIRGMIDELSKNGLVLIYSIEDKEYLEITGWSHQRIDKPQKPKYPAPFFDDSTNGPRTLPPDRIGEDRKGKEEEGGAEAPETNVVSAYAWSGQVIRLSRQDYDGWRKVYSAVPDFDAELRAADDYYAANPPKEGKWFFPVSNWLKKAHQDAAERRRKKVPRI